MTVTTGIERIRIRNYRVLRDIELDGLTPVTALIGANGSGKSTVFDALAFVSESFRDGLAQAWRSRGGIGEIRTRGADGPVEIELTCRIDGAAGQYRLLLDHEDDVPVVAEERLVWTPAEGEPFEALQFRLGKGSVTRPGGKEPVELATTGLLGVGVVSQLAANAEIAAFHRFMSRILVSDLDIEAMRKGSRSDRTVRLSSNGRNIGTVVEQLRLDHPGEWAGIVASLRRYVPRLEDVEPFQLGNGSWIVRLREQGETEQIPPEHISDGTLQLLGYLVALRTETSVLLVEEPEKQVHPRLHYLLAEDARAAESAAQVLVATHAPEFVDALRPDEVWMMFRDWSGSAHARRAADVPRLMAMADNGGLLGSLWTEGFFGVGDPLEQPGQLR